MNFKKFSCEFWVIILLVACFFSLMGCKQQTNSENGSCGSNFFPMEEESMDDLEKYKIATQVELQSYIFYISKEMNADYFPEKEFLLDILNEYNLKIATMTDKMQIDSLDQKTRDTIDIFFAIKKNGIGSLELDIELKKNIEVAYYQQYGDVFVYEQYYGQHQGCEVFFRVNDACVIKNLVLNNAIFSFNYDFEIIVLKNGNFMKLEDAYLEGYFNDTTIKYLEYYHVIFVKEKWQGTEADFKEWYFNLSK